MFQIPSSIRLLECKLPLKSLFPSPLAMVLEPAPIVIPSWINHHHKASTEHLLLNAEPLIRLAQPRTPILRFEDQISLLFLLSYFFGILLPVPKTRLRVRLKCRRNRFAVVIQRVHVLSPRNRARKFFAVD